MPLPDSPGHRPLAEILADALSLIEEAHDTHIYDRDDEHPTDCHYCAIVAEGRKVLSEGQWL